jgi:hypothetical protein
VTYYSTVSDWAAAITRVPFARLKNSSTCQETLGEPKRPLADVGSPLNSATSPPNHHTVTDSSFGGRALLGGIMERRRLNQIRQLKS